MGERAGRYLGDTFGNYELSKRIGEGGFSEVYLGRHPEYNHKTLAETLIMRKAM